MKMDDDMERVGFNLSRLSRNCNSRVVDKTMKNYGDFEQTTMAAGQLLIYVKQWSGLSKILRFSLPDAEHYAFASQLAFFQSCPSAIARLLRKGKSNLLAAKLLVICRLLFKILSQRPDRPPLVDHVRDRLASLRGKLLQRIDAHLGSEKSLRTALLDDMCAFLLATSSSTTDVLRHFLHTRLKAIEDLLDRSKQDYTKISSALRLYFRTIDETRTLLQTQLPPALLGLRSRPLMEDLELRTLFAFHLEPGKSQLPEEILNFTPWLRHDFLQKSTVDSIMEVWEATTFNIFLTGLRESLLTSNGLSAVMQLRRELLETWYSRKEGHHQQPADNDLHKMRSAIADRLKQLVWNRVGSLEIVGHEITRAIQQSDEDSMTSAERLWATSMMLADVGPGAARLKATVLNRLYCRNNHHRQPMKKYTNWLRRVKEVETVIKQLQERHWDEESDLDRDELDFDSCGGQQLKDEPDEIERHISRAINSAFSSLQDHLSGIADRCMVERKGRQAAFLLRVLRDIRLQLPGHGQLTSFGLPLVPGLHRIVVEEVSQKPLHELERLWTKSQLGDSATLATLWEGSPPLPTQPTPALFKFFYDLVQAMSEEGSDIWTVTATDQLKSHVRRCISRMMDLLGKTASAKPSDGDGPEPAVAPTDEVGDSPPDNQGNAMNSLRNGIEEGTTTRHRTQILFDVMLLREALQVPGSDKPEVDELERLERRIMDEVRDLLPSSERLRHNVQEYWKRTALLFSLIA